MTDGIAPRLIATAVTVIAVSLLPLIFRNARPTAAADNMGTIAPEKISALLTVVVGSLMALLGMAGTLFWQTGWAGLALTLAGIAFAGFMAPSLTSLHRVNWTEHGIEGPCKMFGLTLGTARTTIAWEDIVRTGTTITSYWYVEARDGSRVYWSYLYKGYGVLTAFLRRKCPDLKLPARMG